MVTTGSGSRYFLSADVPKAMTSNQRAAIKDMMTAKPGATITLTRQRKEQEAKAAQEVVKKARPGVTISLFGLGGGGDADDSKPAPKKAAKAPAKKGPRGVPSIVSWRENRDGSITGFISGSPNFSEGERITTSPIANGTIDGGQVVTTGSGSRYFLV